ncbi:dihydropteroate synthase [Haloarcula montana]|uniref:dihydropteroate synthase n=1 Tax=Haloarcula montana TaxID=3111776 RepID=UPI002D766D09|nr:dihydropteroate synthase [Haloarcula sp. GH36]
MRTVDAAGLAIGDDQPPRIMGVLNVSKESPYDPSVYDEPDEAAAYVDEELIGEGAHIVDVGLESANKRLDVLSAEQELDRLETAIETIQSVGGDAVFSIETRYAEVAEAALDAGFDMVNDICGFADPEMPEVCREYDVAVGKMASPPDLERPGAVDDVDWAAARSPEWAGQADYVDRVYEALKQHGMTDKTIVDPAFGGWSERKTLEDDRATFRRLREFRGFGQPILVSINRKNFLRSLADRSTEAALPVSLAATSMAIERGAHVVRTHDVAETLDAAKIGGAFAERGRTIEGDVTVSELDVRSAGDVARHLERIGAGEDEGEPFVGHVFELSGLDPSGVDELVTAAADTGVVVRGGSDGALVGGSLAELSALAGALEGTSAGGALTRAIEG